MTAPRDPWADPDTPTEQGAPYSGPPSYPPAYPGAVYAQQGHAPPGYAPPAYAQPGYPPPGYGWPAPAGYGGWPAPVPAGPRRPGQVVTAAVLALVQAGLVAFASAYVLLFASVLGLDLDVNGSVDPRAQSIADEARVLAWVQFASVALLVAAGVVALNRRDRLAWGGLLAALAVQVLLALYWAVRIVGVLDDIPGPDDGAVGVLVFGAVCFGAGPAVGAGLLLTRPAREWFGAGAVRGR
ncbi:hypothetical protein [Blastococcus sp. SYSU D00813]